MKCEFYKNACSIGGPFCKKNGEEAAKDCPTAAELRRIEKLPCPVMEASGYVEPNDRCEQILTVRVTFIKLKGDCCQNNACLVAEVMPEKRAELTQSLPGSKKISLEGLKQLIKETIKRHAQPKEFFHPETASPKK